MLVTSCHMLPSILNIDGRNLLSVLLLLLWYYNIFVDNIIIISVIIINILLAVENECVAISASWTLITPVPGIATINFIIVLGK
jgi:hypothetical protein